MYKTAPSLLSFLSHPMDYLSISCEETKVLSKLKLFYAHRFYIYTRVNFEAKLNLGIPYAINICRWTWLKICVMINIRINLRRIYSILTGYFNCFRLTSFIATQIIKIDFPLTAGRSDSAVTNLEFFLCLTLFKITYSFARQEPLRTSSAGA